MALASNLANFSGWNAVAKVLLDGRNPLVRSSCTTGHVDEAARHAGNAHAHQAAKETFVESVPGLLGDLGFPFDPAVPPSRHVCGVEMVLRERLAGLRPFDDCFRELHARCPRLIHARPGEHVRAARALADPRKAIAHEHGFAASAGFLE